MLLPSSLNVVLRLSCVLLSVYFADICRPVSASCRMSRPNVTPWYWDWPRLPRVLNAVKRGFGRAVAVPVPV